MSKETKTQAILSILDTLDPSSTMDTVLKLLPRTCDEPDTSWILTDDDSAQYRRLNPEIGENVYELIDVAEMYRCSLRNVNTAYFIREGIIDPANVTWETVTDTLAMYGYTPELFVSAHEGHFLWEQVVEMLFETDNYDLDMAHGYPSWNAARNAVLRTIEKEADEVIAVPLDEPWECESKDCVFNVKGVCRFMLVQERAPVITEHDGCREYICAN